MRSSIDKKSKQIDLRKIILKNAGRGNEDIYLIPSKWYLTLLIVILFIADFIIIYTNIEKIIYESVVTNIAFSIIISAVLIIGPIVVAGALIAKDRRKIHIISAGLLSVLLVFICVDIWKTQFQTMICDTSAASHSNNLKNKTSVIGDVKNAEKAFNGLLAVIPIGGSMLCILITSLDAATSSGAKRKAGKYAVKLQEYIEQQEAVIQELEERLKQDLYRKNEELFSQAVYELENREKMAKMKVRWIIADYLANPHAAASLFREDSKNMLSFDNKKKL